MPPEFNLRPATVADLEFLIRIDIEDEGVTEFKSQWTADDFADHRRKIAQFIDEGGARVAESDGKPIAGALWRITQLAATPKEYVFHAIAKELPADGLFCEMFLLWVDPDFRRMGIATELKMAAEEAARTRGVGAIYTHTEASNLHVLSLNEKMGYKQVRRGPIWDDVTRVSLVKTLR